MSKGIPTGKQLFSGKQKWLSPGDYGKVKEGLTGDRDKDMQTNLARYGLHGAVWAPALLNESGKAGSDMRHQAHQERVAQEQRDQFNSIQPSVNNSQFQGQNPYTSGGYNDTAAMLGGQSAQPQMAGLMGPPMGNQSMQMGNQMPQASYMRQQIPGGLSPNGMDPQLKEWLRGMSQANAGQMGGLL